MRGVNIFGIRNGEIAWGRIYMESVDDAGTGMDEKMRGIAGGIPERKGCKP